MSNVRTTVIDNFLKQLDSETTIEPTVVAGLSALLADPMKVPSADAVIEVIRQPPQGGAA